MRRILETKPKLRPKVKAIHSILNLLFCLPWTSYFTTVPHKLPSKVAVITAIDQTPRVLELGRCYSAYSRRLHVQGNEKHCIKEDAVLIEDMKCGSWSKVP